MANHTRSASFPSSKSNPNPNPVMIKISQELKKLQQHESSSSRSGSPLETIRVALSGLSGLYKLCVDDDLLVVPALHDERQLAVAEGSTKLLHLCAAIRAAVSSLRESVSDLLHSEEDTGRNASGYFSLRKDTARTAKALAVSLRQVEATLVSCQEPVSEVTRVVRCVSIITVSVLDSLLHLLMAKSKAKANSSLVSKLMARKAKALAETGNEIGDVDAALHAAVFEEKVVVEQRVRLEALDTGLRGIEDGLSSIATQLTKIRTSLLNTISF